MCDILILVSPSCGLIFSEPAVIALVSGRTNQTILCSFCDIYRRFKANFPVCTEYVFFPDPHTVYPHVGGMTLMSRALGGGSQLCSNILGFIL